MVISIIILTILLLYLIEAFTTIKVWRNTKTTNLRERHSPTKKSISVIIPFRNESDNLPNLLESLKNQSDKENMEYVFVDDHSTDNGKELIKTSGLNYKLIELSDKEKGKKTAINKGVQHSPSDIIVTTDADCIHPKNWLKSIKNYFEDHNPDLLIMPVSYSNQPVSLTSFLGYFEFISLQIVGGSKALKHKPILSNGANLAFKKSIYSIHKTLPEIASGDDIFLLHHLKKEKADIRYLKSKEVLVKSKFPSSISSILNQRIRWAKKSTAVNDFNFSYLGSLILLINLSLLALLVFSIANITCFLLFLVLFISKLIADYRLLVASKDLFSTTIPFGFFTLCQLIYPIYFIFIALNLIFRRSQYWKDRKVS